MATNGDAPLVSVVVATYNWSSVLRYALLSAQNQTFQNFEVLVIGDGCTDDSREVVESLGDSRFRWENLPVNSGHQSTPNNRGIELARGAWISYLGHDDLWMPNHLELLLRRLDETKSDLAFSLAMLVGAPGCNGRMLFPVFEGGNYERGADIPPSTLMHRRSLAENHGNWPNHRKTLGAPEGSLIANFHDHGARFVSLSEVTVFKFPSSWRPHCYANRSCEEQAEFFRRMQQDPDFLHRELIELALATQLLKPHTTVPAARSEDYLRPGAVIDGYRQTRGLTDKRPEQAAPRYVVTAALAKLVHELTEEEMKRKHTSRFTVFEIFWADQGQYAAGNSKQTTVPIGCWTRVRVMLEHGSDGAPLRIDPCERPAVIEVAGIALRRNGKVEWSARRDGLNAIRVAGDASRIKLDRVLTIVSHGNDPILFLPNDVMPERGTVLNCWLRVTSEELKS